jgi:hypothetical protein
VQLQGNMHEANKANIAHKNSRANNCQYNMLLTFLLALPLVPVAPGFVFHHGVFLDEDRGPSRDYGAVVFAMTDQARHRNLSHLAHASSYYIELSKPKRPDRYVPVSTYVCTKTCMLNFSRWLHVHIFS